MKKLFIFFCIVFMALTGSAQSFEMPKPDFQVLKDTWAKVTGSESKNGHEAPKDDSSFMKVWKDFSKISDEAITMATDSQKNSRTLLEFLTAREPKYVRLLKKSQEILSDSEAQEEFNTIDELTLKNKKLQETIVQLQKERISAPLSSYNPMALTKERIDKKINQAQQEIQENKLSIAKLQDNVLKILSKNGLQLSPEEINYFVVSAEGSELVKLMSIAINMKKIQEVIERELINDKNNVNLAKYYTGIYFIALETYLSAHDTILENIPKYRHKNKEIAKEAQANRDEAIKLRRSASPSDLQYLEANIKINDRIFAVSRMYDELLKRRSDALQQSRQSIERKVSVASNTYKTIVNGSSLISLVNNEGSEFALLMNFDMPELKMIYDGPMLNSFIEIAERIRQEP